MDRMIPLKSIKAASLLHCVALECPKLEITQSTLSGFLLAISSAESAKTSYPQSTQAMMYI